MNTIERLRELVVRVKQAPKAFTAKEMAEWSAADAEVYAALPALLAEVERLTKERDELREAVRVLGDALRRAVASCQCRGTGKWETSCTLCGDSTYDHHCNDEVVDCDNVWCIAARAVLASVKGGN